MRKSWAPNLESGVELEMITHNAAHGTEELEVKYDQCNSILPHTRPGGEFKGRCGHGWRLMRIGSSEGRFLSS